jgi:hypothetical protein
MEPSFNELEQRLLRFLKEEFLKKGSKPTTMHDSATMERDVMEKCGLDLPQYREVMARLEHHGIAKEIAIGANNGHVQIYPAIVDIVRQLDEQEQQVKAQNSQPDRVEQFKRRLFSKRWFAVPVIVVFVVGAIAVFLSRVDTIKTLIVKWFGG